MRAVPATRAWLWTDGGDPHLLHQAADAPAAHARKLGAQQPTQHPRAGEGKVQVQRVDPPHEGEIPCRQRARDVIHRAPADSERLGLPGDRQSVRPVDHRLALSRPALPSARSKKSFSSASSPILAWRVFTSTGGSAGSPPGRKSPAAPASSWSFHAVTWPGWTSNRFDNSARVPSLRRAARATLALKAGA